MAKQNKIEVKILQGLMGKVVYPKGSTQYLDFDIAKNWEQKGLCEIIKPAKKNTKQPK